MFAFFSTPAAFAQDGGSRGSGVELQFQVNPGITQGQIVLPAGWGHLEAMVPGSRLYLAFPDGPVTDAQAWDAARSLRTANGVTFAEPAFATRGESVAIVGPSLAEKAKKKALLSMEWDLSRAVSEKDDEWSLKAMHVEDSPACLPPKCVPAWRQVDGGAPDIRICHPDTGFSRHPETFSSRLLTDAGLSFIDGEDGAEDRMITGLLHFPGHGTASSSVIISDLGGHPPLPHHVTGVAYGASLIPLRVASSVVVPNLGVVRWLFNLESPANLTRALFASAAPERRCDVISIAMGTEGRLESMRLGLKDATDNGLIVVAAAGNYVGFVVHPAAFSDELPVVAVAATDAFDLPWEFSSRGREVTVSAPGHLVWTAHIDPDTRAPTVDQGSGTTFATGGVAGVAALWLQHHGGRAAIATKLGIAPNELRAIPCTFRSMLQKTARWPSTWKTVSDGRWDERFTRKLYGAGVVDAAALLSQPLPLPAEVRKSCLGQQKKALTAGSGSLLARLYPELPAAEVTAATRRMLHATDDDAALKENELELFTLLARDPPLRSAFGVSVAAKQTPEELTTQLRSRASAELSRRLSGTP